MQNNDFSSLELHEAEKVFNEALYKIDSLERENEYYLKKLKERKLERLIILLAPTIGVIAYYIIK